MTISPALVTRSVTAAAVAVTLGAAGWQAWLCHGQHVTGLSVSPVILVPLILAVALAACCDLAASLIGRPDHRPPFRAGAAVPVPVPGLGPSPYRSDAPNGASS